MKLDVSISMLRSSSGLSLHNLNDNINNTKNAKQQKQEQNVGNKNDKKNNTKTVREFVKLQSSAIHSILSWL